MAATAAKGSRHEIITSNTNIGVTFYYSRTDVNYVDPHWHNCLEFVYVLDGKVTLHLPEKAPQPIGKDEFLLVNPMEIHSIMSEKNEAIVLQIPQKMYEHFMSPNDHYHFSVPMNPQDKEVQRHLAKVKLLIRTMYENYLEQPDGYLLRFNSLIYELLYELVQHFSVKEVWHGLTPDDKYYTRLREILQYIDAHHNEPVSVSMVANEFNFHPDYIARFFKKYMDCTITEYLYQIRTVYIFRDIQSTDLPLTEILHNHGCQNYRLTITYFRQYFGCTPREMKKKLRQQK